MSWGLQRCCVGKEKRVDPSSLCWVCPRRDWVWFRKGLSEMRTKSEGQRSKESSRAVSCSRKERKDQGVYPGSRLEMDMVAFALFLPPMCS